ncbi:MULTISPECIES: hypothetical protein [unclassified Streptomyces]|uniref:hypothetical protein n=1 Tax=unclassified Streptomyces TaxID=2593676 RepID=UPI00340971C8
MASRTVPRERARVTFGVRQKAYAHLLAGRQHRPAARVLGRDGADNAHDLPHAGHGRKARARLARYDPMMARRRPRKLLPEAD